MKSSKMAVVFGECGRECLSGPGNTAYDITNAQPNIRMYKNVRDLNRQGGRSFGAPIIDENRRPTEVLFRCIFQFGAPRLFQANRLSTELYKQET